MSAIITREERYTGCLLGLAAGDALGTTLEFKPVGTFPPLLDLVGGGPFDLKPGQWTDDTSMALCLADSLIERQGFDPLDQLERYCRWYRDGYLSSTGTCFDIGGATASALKRFQRHPEPYPGSTDSMTAGNGSIMRLAPVPMFYARQPDEAIRRSAESSRTTHGAQSTVDGCRYLGGLIVGALNGVAKAELLSKRYSPVSGSWEADPLHPEIDAIASGSFKYRNPPDIAGTGYVVRTLEAALWAFYHTESFQAGALQVVNLGDDSDTTGAVYGQLAGAYYGLSGLPPAWVEKLAMKDYMLGQAKKLLDLADRPDLIAS